MLTNQCNRCGVFIPKQTEVTWEPRPRHTPKRSEDQDNIGGYTDYARTKADK